MKADFDPVNFYHQASRWYEENELNDQAHWRSIISRGYYAAFLVARKKARISSADENTHKLTAHYYNTSGKSGIGNRLNNLRLKRNESDYDLNKQCAKREAGENLKYAARILTDLGVSLTINETPIEEVKAAPQSPAKK